MAEGRKVDFKITILWALLQAFEELLTIFLIYQTRIEVFMSFVYKHLVTLRKTLRRCWQKFTHAKIRSKDIVSFTVLLKNMIALNL